mgnify:CR=1 FL=1
MTTENKCMVNKVVNNEEAVAMHSETINASLTGETFFLLNTL